MIVIYKIICNINNKIYIGITSNLKYRLKVHYNCYNKNTLLSRAIRKYGKKNFSVEILNEVISWDEAYKKEKEYIKLCNSYMPNGYNMTFGGEGQLGLQHTKKTKKKMSLSHIGKALGKDNPMFGKVGANKGKKFSKQIKEKMSQSMKGRIPWNKGKVCPQLSGENNYFYNNYLHAKLTEIQIKYIRSLIIKYGMIKLLANKFNVKRGTISLIVNNKTWKNIVLDKS